MAKSTRGEHPWRNIWVKPRETVSQICMTNPKHRFVILSFIYGLSMLLHTAQNFSLGDLYATTGIVIVAIVFAPFIGMLAMTIASWLLLWTGKWIGGGATYYPIRAAVSWSNVPTIISLLGWGVLIWFFQDQVFIENFEQLQFSGIDRWIVGGAFTIQAIAAIWSFILLVKGLGAVQGFSAWKGVLNVLIPFFMVGIFIWILSWLGWMVMGAPGA